MLTVRRRFRTKLILIAALGVFIGLTAAVIAALSGVRSLGKDATHELEEGLGRATREYLSNHAIDSANRTGAMLGRAQNDLQVLAAIAQGVIDQGDKLEGVHEALMEASGVANSLRYDKQGHWYQNPKGEPMALAVWGYLIGKDEVEEPPPKKPKRGKRGKKGKATPPPEPAQKLAGLDGPPIRADVIESIRKTALYDLIVPPFQRKGSSNLQVYYVGPQESPYLRIAPWAPAAKEADKKYPAHNKNPFWSFFFPTLVESWMQWTQAAFGPDGRPTQVTILPPYEDAGGGGLVTTFFHPLWSADRKTFAGAMGIDLTLDQIVDYIKDQRIYDSGFAFLAQSNGNVLAINETGERLMGLHQEKKGNAGGGVDVLNRNLSGSKYPTIAKLTLPTDDEVSHREMLIGGRRYVMVLRRLPAFETWAGKLGIAPEQWTLGLVVPASEIYASLTKARASIKRSTNNIILSQSIITAVTLLLVLLGIWFITARMTSTLEALSGAARSLMAKDYDVEVQVRSEDEIGELGVAFNAMASEIRAYTRNLEGLVQQRTQELEQANTEISLLNERLKEENLRMGAELDVARRLQLMVLPDNEELAAIEGLDIAGYMEPADEVGGDYYDVLGGCGGLKIGIGDVTGHGLESGVLMIMLQAAVRTLVLAEERDPERFMNIINKVVYQNIQRTDMDRSMTLSLIDYRDGVLHLVGQHEDAIVVRADGALERIDTMPLGLPVGLEFDISDFLARLEVPLGPGDVMVLYTDGITEAEDLSGEQYGFDRLCDVAKAHHRGDANALKEAIVGDVERFINQQKVFDDITVVVIKREGEEEA